MNRTQKYISILLERLPKYELRSYEHQTTLDRIRDRISEASDIRAELLQLYKVKDCADFALSLMWIADKVEKDPTKEESTIDEETVVFSKFRRAMGDVSPEEAGPGAAADPSGLSGMESMPSSAPVGLSSPAEETTRSVPEPRIDEIFGAMMQQPESTPPAGGDAATGPEQELRFSNLLERFLESVQSGSDDRTKLLSDVMQECTLVLGSTSGAQDYKQFCSMLTEFLKYISDNQYMDDVRVMNILSNIQDPFAQWVRSAPEERAGFLDSINDILRDFKTMFE